MQRWGCNTPESRWSAHASLFGPLGPGEVKVGRTEGGLRLGVKPLPCEGRWLRISEASDMYSAPSFRTQGRSSGNAGLSMSRAVEIPGFWFAGVSLPQSSVEVLTRSLPGCGTCQTVVKYADDKSGLSVRNEMFGHEVTFNCVSETPVRATCGFTYSAEVIIFQAVSC